MSVRRLPWVLLSTLALTGCVEAGNELVVDLRTDFRPGLEFFAVRTELVGAAAAEAAEMRITPVTGDDTALLDGIRVAEFSGITRDRVLVIVALLDRGGTPLVARPVRVTMGGTDRGVTAVITRSCRDVLCPAPDGDQRLVACQGGECVEPECSPETPEACSSTTAECTADADCASGSLASCSTARCALGVCLVGGDDATCDSSTWCQPEVGCVPFTTTIDDGGMDAGMPDADAAADADAGVMDAGDASDATDVADADASMITLACPLGTDPIGAFPPAPDPVPMVSPTCGDGTVDTGEDCDDGARVDGDGCSANCFREGTCNAPFDLLMDTTTGTGGELRWRGELDTWENLEDGTCSSGDGREVIFRFVPPFDGLVRAAGQYVVDGSYRDTVLYSRQRCAQADTEIACNDDVTAYTPYLDFVARAGEPIFLFFENYSDYAGFDELIVRFDRLLPDGTACDPAQVETRCAVGSDCIDDGSGGHVCGPAVCGNGVIEADEGCDDGNAMDWDGCSSRCHLECGSCATPLDFSAVATADADGTLRFVATHKGARDRQLSRCSPNRTAPELVYSYVAPTDGTLTVAVDSADDSYIPMVDVRSDCTDLGTTLSCASSYDMPGWDPATVSVRVRASETYYILSEWVGDENDLDIFNYETRLLEMTAKLEPHIPLGGACTPSEIIRGCAEGLSCLDRGSGFTCVATVCGDGTTEGIEQCDDGAAVAGDGCDASCRFETAPSGGTTAPPPSPSSWCPPGRPRSGRMPMGRPRARRTSSRPSAPPWRRRTSSMRSP